MRGKRRLNLDGSEPVARDVDDIIQAARDPVVAIRIAPCAVAREVEAQKGAEISFQKALAIAQDLGLDPKALQDAANTPGVTRNLREVQELAGLLGISGTPSYIIGTELVPGAAGYDALQEKVSAMRQCGAATC